MGLAASQARLLLLTSRMSDIDYQQMRLANQKIAMCRESSDLSTNYSDALNRRKLSWNLDGAVENPVVDLTYGMLMNPTTAQTGQYLVSDTNGRIVLDDKLADAMGATGDSGTAPKVSATQFLQTMMNINASQASTYVNSREKSTLGSANYDNMFTTLNVLSGYNTQSPNVHHQDHIAPLSQALETLSSQLDAEIQTLTQMTDEEMATLNIDSLTYKKTTDTPANVGIDISKFTDYNGNGNHETNIYTKNYKVSANNVDSFRVDDRCFGEVIYTETLKNHATDGSATNLDSFMDSTTKRVYMKSFDNSGSGVFKQTRFASDSEKFVTTFDPSSNALITAYYKKNNEGVFEWLDTTTQRLSNNTSSANAFYDSDKDGSNDSLKLGNLTYVLCVDYDRDHNGSNDSIIGADGKVYSSNIWSSGNTLELKDKGLDINSYEQQGDGSYIVQGVTNITTSSESLDHKPVELKFASENEYNAFMCWYNGAEFDPKAMDYTITYKDAVANFHIIREVKDQTIIASTYNRTIEDKTLAPNHNSELAYLLRMKRGVRSIEQFLAAYNGKSEAGADIRDQYVTTAVNLLLTGGGPTLDHYDLWALMTNGLAKHGDDNKLIVTSELYHKVDYGFDKVTIFPTDTNKLWTNSLGAVSYQKGAYFSENLYDLFSNYATIRDAREVKDAGSNKVQDKANFYLNIYDAVKQNGWVKNRNITNTADKTGNYLQNQLLTGNAYIRQLQYDGTWAYISSATYNSPMASVRDDDAITEYEYKYQRDKDEIDNKETEIDLKIKNLETERSSMEAEMSSVKQLVTKGVDVLKIFQA